MEFVKWFNSQILKRPITSELQISFILTFGSDIVCQYLECRERQKNFLSAYVPQRSFHLALFRVLAVPPFIHHWNRFLANQYPNNSLGKIVIKSLLDRVIIGGVLILSFFASQTYLNGGTYDEFKIRIEKEYLKTLATNVLFWGSLQIASFKYIHSALHGIFFNTISFFWMIYMSYVVSKKIKSNQIETIVK